MNSKVQVLGSAIVLGILLCGCAPGEFEKDHRAQLVEQVVPGLLQASLANAGESGAAEAIVGNVGRLKSKGWLVEELSENASYDVYQRKYSTKEYIVPRQKWKEEAPGGYGEAAWDFSTISMMDSWRHWSALFWEMFLGSAQEFDKTVRGHYFRLVAPVADRVYDVVILRPVNPKGTLVPDPVMGEPTERLWKDINPAKRDEFPRMSIFGPARYVEPLAAKRFNANRYAVLEVYAKRYFSDGSFLGAEYGSTRVRDTYIMVLISKKEFIAVQTVLYNDTTLEVVTKDLARIVGAAGAD